MGFGGGVEEGPGVMVGVGEGAVFVEEELGAGFFVDAEEGGRLVGVEIVGCPS